MEVKRGEYDEQQPQNHYYYPTAGIVGNEGAENKYTSFRETPGEEVYCAPTPDVQHEGSKSQQRNCLSAWWSTTRWTREIAAMVASLLFEIAAIVVLAYMDGKALFFWDFFISLNAMIAIITTAARASLLIPVASCISQWKWVHFKTNTRQLREMDVYDEASRGSLGSLKFLLRIRWGIPAIGALVTIVTLGIDAFSQQIIALETRMVAINGASTVLYAHEYNTGAVTGGLSPSSYSPVPMTQDFAMQAAVYRGVFNLANSSTAFCNSKCTFPNEYYTLAVASTCSNVTAATLKAMRCGWDVESVSRRCNLTTPGAVNMTLFNIPTEVKTHLTINVTRIAGMAGHTRGLTGVQPGELMHMAIYRGTNEPFVNTMLNSTDGEIFDCKVSLMGLKATNVTATQENVDWGETELISFGTYVEDERRVVFSANGYPDLTVNKPDMGAMLDFLQSSQFTGSMFDGFVGSAPESLRALGVTGGFLNGSIPDTMDRMASSMTDHIRLGVNKQVMAGTEERPVVFVKVLWAWMSLPILAQIATAVLLLLTVVHNRRHQSIGLFKSSNVALLAHDIVLPEGVLRTDIRKADDLYYIGRSVKVRLE